MSSRKAKPEWQPISTAPKDGTTIIIAVEGYIALASWATSRPYKPTPYKGGYWEFQDDALNRWLWDQGHWPGIGSVFWTPCKKSRKR